MHVWFCKAPHFSGNIMYELVHWDASRECNCYGYFFKVHVGMEMIDIILYNVYVCSDAWHIIFWNFPFRRECYVWSDACDACLNAN